MMEKQNIPEMQSDFERIRHKSEDGKEYWSARELCSTLGYSSYQMFGRLLTKAIEIARQKGLNPDDHFNQQIEMVQLGSGAFRRVENLHPVGYRVNSYPMKRHCTRKNWVIYC